MPQRKKLSVAIITQKLGTDAASTSTVISKEAIARKHKVYEFLPEQLKYEEGKLLAFAAEYPNGKKTYIELAKMDVVLFRPNPPVDMAYLTTLFLLRTIEDKVLIINRPTSVINFPEKIFPLYMREFMPPTLITSQKAEVEKFAAKHGEIIIKPLYDYGGHGISKIKKGQKFKLSGNTPMVIQKFIPEVSKGDKRILFVNFKFAGAFRRTPKKGSFLANQLQGGSVTKAELTKTEKLICKRLQPLLKENDIWICGIDVIHDHITEINITSPTGFKWAFEHYGTKPEIELWDKIEAKLKRS